MWMWVDQHCIAIANMGTSPTNQATWSPCYVNNPNKKYFAGYTGYTKVSYRLTPL